MGAKILDGKAIAADIKEVVRIEVEALVAAGKRQPGLAVIQVGADPASSVYVRNKRSSAIRLESSLLSTIFLQKLVKINFWLL
jgi:5,10-methylene-tetrahydrofolate dehydrogenase/Met henyl tetrahydrofolate cyclohydrolase